jgi:hypothetical protein
MSQALETELGERTFRAARLSEKVSAFHSSCSGFVDSVPATGRFRFRSLLAKLEEQSRELSRAGAASSAKPPSVVDDIKATVREMTAVVQR